MNELFRRMMIFQTLCRNFCCCCFHDEQRDVHRYKHFIFPATSFGRMCFSGFVFKFRGKLIWWWKWCWSLCSLELERGRERIPFVRVILRGFAISRRLRRIRWWRRFHKVERLFDTQLKLTIFKELSEEKLLFNLLEEKSLEKLFFVSRECRKCGINPPSPYTLD